ncbi:hypothetical protein DRU63_16200, partial [Salmonella enterica subsp. arizonae]|nr:hypothetical protein [Salmonella enterica subsp. arizonae]
IYADFITEVFTKVDFPTPLGCFDFTISASFRTAEYGFFIKQYVIFLAYVFVPLALKLPHRLKQNIRLRRRTTRGE